MKTSRSLLLSVATAALLTTQSTEVRSATIIEYGIIGGLIPVGNAGTQEIVAQAFANILIPSPWKFNVSGQTGAAPLDKNTIVSLFRNGSTLDPLILARARSIVFSVYSQHAVDCQSALLEVYQNPPVPNGTISQTDINTALSFLKTTFFNGYAYQNFFDDVSPAPVFPDYLSFENILNNSFSSIFVQTNPGAPIANNYASDIYYTMGALTFGSFINDYLAGLSLSGLPLTGLKVLNFEFLPLDQAFLNTLRTSVDVASLKYFGVNHWLFPSYQTSINGIMRNFFLGFNAASSTLEILPIPVNYNDLPGLVSLLQTIGSKFPNLTNLDLLTQNHLGDFDENTMSLMLASALELTPNTLIVKFNGVSNAVFDAALSNARANPGSADQAALTAAQAAAQTVALQSNTASTAAASAASAASTAEAATTVQDASTAATSAQNFATQALAAYNAAAAAFATVQTEVAKIGSGSSYYAQAQAVLVSAQVSLQSALAAQNAAAASASAAAASIAGLQQIANDGLAAGLAAQNAGLAAQGVASTAEGSGAAALASANTAATSAQSATTVQAAQGFLTTINDAIVTIDSAITSATTALSDATAAKAAADAAFINASKDTTYVATAQSYVDAAAAALLAAQGSLNALNAAKSDAEAYKTSAQGKVDALQAQASGALNSLLGLMVQAQGLDTVSPAQMATDAGLIVDGAATAAASAVTVPEATGYLATADTNIVTIGLAADTALSVKNTAQGLQNQVAALLATIGIDSSLVGQGNTAASTIAGVLSAAEGALSIANTALTKAGTDRTAIVGYLTALQTSAQNHLTTAQGFVTTLENDFATAGAAKTTADAALVSAQGATTLAQLQAALASAMGALTAVTTAFDDASTSYTTMETEGNQAKTIDPSLEGTVDNLLIVGLAQKTGIESMKTSVETIVGQIQTLIGDFGGGGTSLFDQALAHQVTFNGYVTTVATLSTEIDTLYNSVKGSNNLTAVNAALEEALVKIGLLREAFDAAKAEKKLVFEKANAAAKADKTLRSQVNALKNQVRQTMKDTRENYLEAKKDLRALHNLQRELEKANKNKRGSAYRTANQLQPSVDSEMNHNDSEGEE